jgi:NhaP-type Na+/H+ or K+/H+ antiporter
MGGFFIYLLAASVGLGVAVGLAVSLLLKKRGMSDSPIGETALVFLVGFFSYLCSEYLHLSGIMSLFTCSMVMSHYTF